VLSVPTAPRDECLRFHSLQSKLPGTYTSETFVNYFLLQLIYLFIYDPHVFTPIVSYCADIDTYYNVK
jgi:hypothetical protein